MCETWRLGDEADAGTRGRGERGTADSPLPKGEGSTQHSALSTQDWAPTPGRVPVVVGISGASGAALARRTILRLGEAGYPVVATCSRAGRRVWQEELDEPFDAFVQENAGRLPLEVIDVDDIGASVASGRRLTLGMLVVPCSMDTLSAIAYGRSTNLLERAADVTLKEGRPLVLVPRESPFSAIHLENMLKVARLGVRIVPPVPAFYLRPSSVDEVVEDVVDRAIGALGIRDLPEGPRGWNV